MHIMFKISMQYYNIKVFKKKNKQNIINFS